MAITNIRLDSENARWIDTQQALSSVKGGKIIHEKAVKTWLETWGTVDEKYRGTNYVSFIRPA